MRALRTFLFILLFIGVWPNGGRTGEGSFPSFKDDLDRESLRRAIHRSLDYLARVPPDRPVGEWPRKITAREVTRSLITFMNLLNLWHEPEALAREIRSRFILFDPAGYHGSEEVLFTGYYQPIIEGSLTESRQYPFPVYGKPKDLIEAELVTLTPEASVEKLAGRFIEDRWLPYFSRHEIDTLGRLRGKGYEIAWVKDPVELFFLHIQGSGILRLPGGRRVHLNYAASNGRPYKSIGRILVDGGKVAEETLSMHRLRRYLADHPEESAALMAQNERYIFFRFVKEGPLGSLEVPLTPGRSIATDGRLFPKGALAFVVSRKPVLDRAGNLVDWRPFSRFVLNQDTGNAIRGLRRVDLYFGSGSDSGLAAGSMKSGGRLYFLIEKRQGS